MNWCFVFEVNGKRAKFGAIDASTAKRHVTKLLGLSGRWVETGFNAWEKAGVKLFILS